MKKKYIIIPLIVLLVVSLIFISVKLIKNQRESEELEAIQIFENRAVTKTIITQILK